ncbi:MAG: GntR family transcriptional regulator [Verrucomicrobiota bacterium]
MKQKQTAYQKMAQTLRKQITAGKRAAGSRLPTEMELAGTHGVSRITVRHALQLLEDEGLILRRPKLGTFVSSNPHRLVPVSIDYTGSLQLHAPDAERTLLTYREESAGQVADLLKLAEETPVLYSERCDRLNGVAFAWDRGVIPLKHAKKLIPEDLEDVALVEKWSTREDLQISSIQQTVETVTNPVAARHLGLPAKHPLLKTTECYFEQNNRPCGVFTTYYHPEHVQLRIRYAGSAKTPR